jgi:DNA-directed RNA polymerase specialized sigma24 family protein
MCFFTRQSSLTVLNILACFFVVSVIPYRLQDYLKQAPAAVMTKEKMLQRQHFFSLYEFALRVCYRYCSIIQDPEPYIYKGFVNFFKSERYNLYKTQSESSSAKHSFKCILIDTYINQERANAVSEKQNIDLMSLSRNKPALSIEPHSAKEIINTLRRLPFTLRMLFNLSVIDRFSNEEISLKMQIPANSVETYITEARNELKRMFIAEISQPA